jgi:hypothetical protein
LKVEIRDDLALEAVSPEAVEGYLQNTGWQRKPQVNNLYSSWTNSLGSEEIDVLVPSQRSVLDYRARMADILRDLEQIEKRSQLMIFEDLLTANADIFRVVLLGPSYRTSLLPIDGVIETVRAARELLLAAACSVVRLEPFYPSRPTKPKPATDFLKTVRLAAAEQGEVNLKFLAEVPAALRFPFDDQVPFARATMLMLHSALDFAHGAQEYPYPVNREDLTDESIRAGVSANLCDALVAMCTDLSDDHAIELMISFAPALPTTQAAGRSWQFKPSHRDFLKALAQQLRESGIDDEYHLIGFVHTITQHRRDSDYLVTILAWIREKVARVNIHFDKDQTALATEAFQQRVPIECFGRLQDRKQTFLLDHPHDVKLYSYPDDPTLDRIRPKPPQAEESPLFETKKERKRGR